MFFQGQLEAYRTGLLIASEKHVHSAADEARPSPARTCTYRTPITGLAVKTLVHIRMPSYSVQAACKAAHYSSEQGSPQ
jgi:hypothetical protein